MARQGSTNSLRSSSSVQNIKRVSKSFKKKRFSSHNRKSSFQKKVGIELAKVTITDDPHKQFGDWGYIEYDVEKMQGWNFISRVITEKNKEHKIWQFIERIKHVRGQYKTIISQTSQDTRLKTRKSRLDSQSIENPVQGTLKITTPN